MWLKQRSTEKELLDQDNIPTEDLYCNLRELHFINRNLGGYKASGQGMRMLLRENPDIQTVLDVGFGGGDFMRKLNDVAVREQRSLFFYGVDLKHDCVNYAAENLQDMNNVALICNDYRNIDPALLQKTDVIHCSLFLHHLTNEEIVGFFRFAKDHNCIFLANDLQRHWFAYKSIKILTKLFARSYLVKNDAAVSVKRGFSKQELISLLHQAGFKNFKVKWIWAFRYLVIAEP